MKGDIVTSNGHATIGKGMYSEWKGSKGVAVWKAQDDTHSLLARVSLLN